MHLSLSCPVTRLPRVAWLAALLLAGCGPDKPASQVPTTEPMARQEAGEPSSVVQANARQYRDAPALALADVGIAMGQGTAVAKEVADITLTGGQLGSIVALRRMSEGLMGRLNGSFKEVMVINSTLLAAGIGGIISPQVSSLLHNASTVALSMRNGKRYDA